MDSSKVFHFDLPSAFLISALQLVFVKKYTCCSALLQKSPAPHLKKAPFAEMPGNTTLVKYPTPNFLSF